MTPDCCGLCVTRLCPPALGQIAAEASLDTTDEYFESVYHEYIKRRNFMVEALNKMPGVVCPIPKGAFYSIVKLPVDDAEKFAQWLLEEFDYNGQTVMLAPASGFYYTPGLGKNEVRIRECRWPRSAEDSDACACRLRRSLLNGC